MGKFSRRTVLTTGAAAGIVLAGTPGNPDEPPQGLVNTQGNPAIADEWQYYIKGTAEMTVFNAGPKAVTTDFRAGDIGYVKRSLGHYIRNTGDTGLVFLEVFNAAAFKTISLSDWLARTPAAMVAAHLNSAPGEVGQFPKGALAVMPVGAGYQSGAPAPAR